MADLGKKHECSECGAKFYDLAKPDPVCPRCGTPVSESDEEPPAKNRRKRRTAPAPAKARTDAGEEFSNGDGDEEFDGIDDEDLDDEEIDSEELEGLEDDDEDEEEEDDDED